MRTLALGSRDVVDREYDRQGWIGSIGLHIMVLLALLLVRHYAPEPVTLTEFTLLDEPVAAAAPAAHSPAQAREAQKTKVEQAAPDPAPKPLRYQREDPGKVKPKPQAPDIAQDQMAQRLQALRQSRRSLAVDTPDPNALLVQPAAAPAPTPSNGSAELVRDSKASAPAPAPLRRAGHQISAPRLAAAVPTRDPLPKAAHPEIDTTVRRTLGDVSLVGAAADRPLLEHPMPLYPEWAKDSAVEASVTLVFVVLPDGHVKENVLVEKTSGYQDFDERARRALLEWRFAALPAGSTTEQWGAITLRYRLHD